MGWDDPAYVPAIAEPKRILTALDRCDWGGCEAAAYKLWSLKTGSLAACGHHANEASEKVDVLAVYFVDELWAI